MNILAREDGLLNKLTSNRLTFLYLVINNVISTLISVRRICCLCKVILYSILFVALSIVSFAQERCGTVEYTAKLKSERNLFEDNSQFEKWIRQKQQEKSSRSGALRKASTYQVPVVVHIIHNGEAIGSGRNISDAQVFSQLSVLNKDYKRLNEDAVNTPAEFQSVAGVSDIEFVLAKQDPEGLATNGIVRVQGPKTSWTMNDNYQLKALSYWPAEDYLNIWVCNLTDFLGYAQFPVSGLPGLENSSSNRLTDGVVSSTTTFGSIEDGDFNLQNNYNKGRTTTHEVGHFFGLRHIWGDDNGGCSGTDYVDDTPNQAGSTSGCPAHPRVTCEVTSMFQNFLDYTHDNCMNLFTQGQVSRMETVIENSPRRASLTSSPGLSEPEPIANDLGIREVISPLGGECTTPFIPAIEIRNYGSNSVSSTRIRVRKDGVIVETKDFIFSPALNLLESTIVTFDAISFTSGQHNCSFEILLTNSVADGSAGDNTLSRNVFVPQDIDVPFLENFNTLPTTWAIVNPDQNITWELAVTPTAGTNTALKMDFFNYEDNVGEIDMFISPVFDLTDAPAALLKFDVAHSRYQSSSNDGLRVVLLRDCSIDVTQGTVIYNKFGSALATAPSTSSAFTPNGPNQWRTEAIDLSIYMGEDNLQLAFIGINDWGNNLYLDNISLTTTPVLDVRLVEVTAPSPVICLNQVVPKLRIRNSGTLVSTLQVVTTVNGQTFFQSLNGLSLEGSKEIELELNSITLVDGENEVSFVITTLNGESDFNPADNSIQLTIVVDKTADVIPLRENFEDSFEDHWTSINPAGGMVWETTEVISGKALYFNAFNNTVAGDKAWFVSPVLDFSNAVEASLTYDLSYAFRSGRVDLLYILASTDCGYTYSDTIAELSRSSLSDGRTLIARWEPDSDGDWSTKTHVISSLAGNSNVRLAFVFVNNNGNNIYLDNIEIFVSENPQKFNEPFSLYPNPALYGEAFVSFNLEERTSVKVEVIDPVGKILIRETLPNILNQTFPINLTGEPAGVYVVRINAGEKVYFRKLIIVK